MNREEIARLASLLEKLKEEGLTPPHMPYPVWKALRNLVPQPAVEVIISRTGRDFLLTHRQDEHWDGWHIPGGYMGCKESVADACDRVARRELGVGVRFKRTITAFMWPDHPYASTLSLVCLCEAEQLPAVGTFFTRIPDQMIPHHREFVEAFLEADDRSKLPT